LGDFVGDLDADLGEFTLDGLGLGLGTGGEFALDGLGLGTGGEFALDGLGLETGGEFTLCDLFLGDLGLLARIVFPILPVFVTQFPVASLQTCLPSFAFGELGLHLFLNIYYQV
jgi:hypothetical protein